MAVTSDDIQGLYIAYFNRPADFLGLQFWTDAANKAGGINTVANAFAASPEYTAAFAGKSTPQIIDQIYMNLFGRHAELDGIKFWGAALDNHVLGVGNIAYQIMKGAQDTDGGFQDKTAVANKVQAATAFYNALDTSAEVIAYSGDAANAVVKAWLTGVTDQASLDAATSDTGLAAVTAAVVTAGTPQPPLTTSTLTTGVDTASANIFNALLTTATPATATLNAFDNLNGLAVGGTANNVLNINSDGTALPLGVTVSNIQTVNINATGDQAANIAGWTSVKNLNITQVAGAAAPGAAIAVTAAGTTAINDTGVVTGAFGVSINGGSTVTATVSGSDATGATLFGAVNVGNATAPTDAVTLTNVQTITNALSGAGNVNVAGATAVTVNSTVNAGAALLASTGTVAAGKAGTVSVTGGAGAVVVNNVANVTDAAADVINSNAVAVTGGTTVTVNNTVTSSAAAQATALASAVDGNVTVLDGGTVTSVTINNQQTSAVAAQAAVVATPATVVAGGPGFSAVTTVPAVAGSAAVPGVLGVTAGVVTIAGATAGHLLANASNTIASATIAGYAAGSYINSAALKTLTLSGKATGAGALTIDNVGAAPITTLALNLNGFSDQTTGAGTNGIIVNNNGISTLNVTTGGSSSSTLQEFADTSLTTLNVAGSQTLTLKAVPTSLTAINISGAAGFNDNGSLAAVAASGTGLNFKTTSSGKITATLHANGSDTFTGSTGQDVISISADQLKAVTAGSATNNELILKGTAATFVAGANHTWGSVSGFSTLGINSAVANGTYNAAAMGANTFNAVEIVSGTGTTATISNVAKNASLAIDQTIATPAALVYQSVDATGGSDVVTLTLGTSSGGAIVLGTAADTGATALLSSLVMEDANQVGIGTLNVVSNDTAANAGAQNEIHALADSGLTNLNVSGVDGLLIDNFNQGATLGVSATAATAFTMNNTSGGAVVITNFTDSALGSLTFSGTGSNSVTNLLGVTGHVVTLTNSGTGSASVGAFADANLTTLTINGNVKLGADATVGAPGVLPAASAATGATTGVTVNASTDNAHINLNLTGAAAGATDTIKVGNANNFITDGSTAGIVNVTVGTGANLVDLSAGGHTGVLLTDAANATYAANVTLGAHTDTASLFDVVKVGVTGAQTAGFSTTITGAVKGDVIAFAQDGAASVLVTLSAAQQTAVTNAASLSAAIALAFGDTGAAHNVASFTYGGDTYVIDNVGADTAFTAGVDSIVHIVGSHTIAAAAGAVATISFAS